MDPIEFDDLLSHGVSGTTKAILFCVLVDVVHSNVDILCALQYFYYLNKVLLLGQGLLAFLLIVLAGLLVFSWTLGNGCNVSSKYHSCCSSCLISVSGHCSITTYLIFLSWKFCCLRRTSVEDVWPSRTHFFGSFSNCSLKILLGSSKTCIFPSVLFTGSLPLIEKLSSLLAKLDIESSRSAG
ncbi:hypothetical protein Tco_0188680 [Tanacetum coccineum]